MAVERFSALVGANIKQFQRRMDEVDRKIKSIATGADVDVTATISDFQKDINKVKRDINALRAISADVEVTADIDRFEKNIKEVEGAIAAIDKLSPEIDIDILMAEFRKKMAKIHIEVNNLKTLNADIEVDADLSRFNRAMKILKAKMLALNGRNIVIHVQASYRDFQRTMGRIASQMRNWGEILMHQLIGGLLMIIPMISPLIATLVGLLGSLGVMMGTVAGSTFALATVFGVAGAAAVAFGAVAIPTIQALFAETAQLTAQQQKAKDAFNGFKSTYNEIVKATEAPVLSAFTTAMNTANQILQNIRPLFITSAEAVDRLMKSLQQNINSKSMQDFFHFLNTQGAGMLETVVSAVGNLFKGLLTMMTAFAPLAQSTAQGFLEISQGFAAWAEGLKTSETFKTFMDFVAENMPKISTIFGKAIEGIVYFFSAFSGMGSDFMSKLAEMMTSFSSWAQNLGQNRQFQEFLNYIREVTPQVLQLIGNLTKFLVNLGIGMAPIGDAVMGVVNNFLSFMNGLMESSDLIRTLISAIVPLIGAFMTFTPIIVGINALLGGKLFGTIGKLIPSFSGIANAISKVGPFFTNLGSIIARIVPFLLNLGSKILPALGSAIGVLSGPIGLIIGIVGSLIAIGVMLYKNWDKVKEAAGKLKDAVVKKFNEIKDGISEKIERMKELIVAGVIFWTQFVPQKIDEMKQAAINKFKDIVFGILGKLIEIKTNITNKMNEAIDFLKGINLLEIGKNIIQGLVDGIKSIPVLGSVVEIGEKIVSGFKSFFQIHSPSRLMEKLSSYIPQGVSVGIIGALGYVRKATNKMGEAAIPDFSQTLAISQDMITKVQQIVSNAARKTSVEVTKLQQEQADKIANINKKMEDDIQRVKKASSGKLRSMTRGEKEEITQLERESANEIAKIQREYGEKILKVQSEVNQMKLDDLQAYVDTRKELNEMSLKQEAEFWQYAATAFKDGTDDKKRALIKYQKAYEAVLKEQFDLEQMYIDKAVKFNRMSMTEQIKAYETYMAKYAEGSEQRLAYEEMIYDKKKEMHEKIKSLSDDYLAKVKEVQQKQIDGEKQLRDEFKKTHDDRKKQIKDFAGLYDKFTGNDMKDVDLIGNLEGQVDALYGWMTNLQTLSARGFSQDLIAEIQELGVGYANELQALTQMSDEKITEFQNLWQTKNALADAQATFELSDEKLVMEQKLKDLNNATATELNSLKTQFAKDMKEIRFGTEGEFDIMKATLPEIGKNAMQGLINGMRSMESDLKNQAQKITQIVQSSFNDALRLFNLSDSTMQPVFNGAGFNQSVANSVNVASSFKMPENDEQEPQPIIIQLHQNWTGEDVLTYIEQNQSKNYNAELYKEGDVW